MMSKIQPSAGKFWSTTPLDVVGNRLDDRFQNNHHERGLVLLM